MENSICAVLHGGAGTLSEEHGEKKLPHLREALNAAWEVLCDGESGEYAVAAALRVMEGCEYFNAGFGAYPNADGIVLLDVGLMRGTGDFISLLNVRKLKYPSAVALDMFSQGRALMSIWTHEMMTKVENSSSELKAHYGVVESHQELIAPFVSKLIAEKGIFEVEANTLGSGTVGCVVRDTSGKLHAGTSTGGLRLKYNGRIGDTPIIGAGVYANNDICALSTTGYGEAFLRSHFSGFVIAEIRARLRENIKAFEDNPQVLTDILDSELNELQNHYNGNGGVIIIPSRGAPQYAFNSEMMSVAARTGTCNEVTTEEIFVVTKHGKKLTLDTDTGKITTLSSSLKHIKRFFRL
jgi:L-asparaginase / beta-aspartyl-peptidase